MTENAIGKLSRSGFLPDIILKSNLILRSPSERFSRAGKTKKLATCPTTSFGRAERS
jgi:hypothetical protein